MLQRLQTAAEATFAMGNNQEQTVTVGLEMPPRKRPGAGRRFDEILVQQLSRAMSNHLLRESFIGEEGPRWMGSYPETQRAEHNEAFADHLVEGGSIRLSDLMLCQLNVLETPREREIDQ